MLSFNYVDLQHSVSIKYIVERRLYLVLKSGLRDVMIFYIFLINTLEIRNGRTDKLRYTEFSLLFLSLNGNVIISLC